MVNRKVNIDHRNVNITHQAIHIQQAVIFHIIQIGFHGTGLKWVGGKRIGQCFVKCLRLGYHGIHSRLIGLLHLFLVSFDGGG